VARYVELSFITSSVPAGEALTVSQTISASHVNLVKLKVVPGVIGGTTRFQVYKRATFVDADNLYDTRDFEGNLIDPVLDYSDPMTDIPGATAERNEGPPIPYEDADDTLKLHLRIFNGDTNPKPYSVTIWYEIPALVVGGLVNVPALNVTGSLNVDGNTTIESLWVNGGAIDISGAAPSLYFTDITASAKGMKIVVDGNLAYLTEKTAAIGTLWTYDLVNLRAGINAITPCSLLANTNVSVTGSEGFGPSPTALTWRNNSAGWGMMVGVDLSVTNSRGLLVYGTSAPVPLFKVESVSYANTFIVTGDGRMGIGSGTLGTAVMVDIKGDQRPSDIVLQAYRSVAGTNPVCNFANTYADNQAVIWSISYAPNGPNISLYYIGTPAIHFVTSALANTINMVARDFGTGPGSHILLGHNTNASTPSAGYVNFIQRSGVGAAVWCDAAGNLRIWGNTPDVSDTGGTVIGTQISVREAKEIVRPITPADRMTAVEHLIETPLYVYLLNNEVGAGFNHFHVGFIADEQPAWMMYDSNSIDEHRIEMELVIGFQDHELRLRALEGAELPTELPAQE
jgi:hypothetical protein